VAGRIAQLQHNIAVEWLFSRKQWYQEELAALLAGDRSKSGGLLDGAANVRTLTKVVNGVGYVFAYNYTNASQPVTFTWQSAPTSVKESKTGKTFPVSGASWSDTFGPYQARIYIINGAGGTPTTPTPPPPSGGGLGLSFSNPADGATVSGATTVTMSATGGSGYEFAVKVDGATVYSGSNPSFSWNTATVADGSRTLAATVTDSQGRTATANRMVKVLNTTVSPPPPGGASFTVAFSYPAAGKTVRGSQTVGLSTTAPWGQAKTFTLSVDGTVIATQSGSATTMWHSWDTTTVGDGPRTLTATVTMNGETATATLPVTVTNTTPTLTLDVGARVGDASPLSLTVDNPGGAVSMDVYLGVLLPPEAGPGLGCPQGDAIAFAGDTSPTLAVRCASASPATFPRFAAGASIPAGLPPTTLPDFFGLSWASASSGRYVVFMAFTPPGSLADGTTGPGDIIAIDSDTVTVAP
jgi:hypothetical protein